MELIPVIVYLILFLIFSKKEDLLIFNIFYKQYFLIYCKFISYKLFCQWYLKIKATRKWKWNLVKILRILVQTLPEVLNPKKYEYMCLCLRQTSDDVFQYNGIIHNKCL